MFTYENDRVNKDRDYWTETYISVIEKGVHTPGERLDPSIHIIESGLRREFATVLMLNVLDVGTVFSLHIVHPGYTNSNLKRGELK